MKNKKVLARKLFLIVIITGFFASIFLPAFAQAEAFNYKLLESFPGFFSAGKVMTDFPAMILAIYKFGIWTVGIAGLFMLVVGGFMYMASAGNTSTAGNARGIISDALFGIVAALGAYLIMYVINPDLTKINMSFTAVEIISETEGAGNSTAGTSAGNTTGSTTGACTGTNAGCCMPNTSCVTCKGSCADFSNGYANLCFKGAGNTGCKLNSVLATRLNNANLASVNAEVSEAWPPTMSHKSICHQDGTCADVRCKAQCDNESIANIKKIYDALKNAGLNPVYETKKDCAPYKNADITSCGNYSTMTSPSSFHVNM